MDHGCLPEGGKEFSECLEREVTVSPGALIDRAGTVRTQSITPRGHLDLYPVEGRGPCLFNPASENLTQKASDHVRGRQAGLLPGFLVRKLTVHSGGHAAGRAVALALDGIGRRQLDAWRIDL